MLPKEAFCEVDEGTLKVKFRFSFTLAQVFHETTLRTSISPIAVNSFH